MKPDIFREDDSEGVQPGLRQKRSTAKTLLILAGLLLAGLFAVACSDPIGDPPDTTLPASVESQEEFVVTRVVRQTVQIEVTPVVEAQAVPVILDIGVEGGYTTLDPQITDNDNALNILENILVGLTWFNPETNAIEPQLAESWEITEDGLLWTFNLRDDIFWMEWGEPGGALLGSDQLEARPRRPVTADDVVFAIRRACDPRVLTPDIFILFIIEGCERVYRSLEVGDADLEQIGVRAIDEQTLEFTLNKPAGYFLTMTSLGLMRPVPADEVQEMAEEWAMPENMFTSGPFLLSPQTLMGTRTVLQRNTFWPIPFTGNVDTVNIVNLSAEDAYRLWEERLLDISPVPVADQTTILDKHGAKSELVSNQEVFYLSYDATSPAFSSPEVRRAFGYAIDRERLVREVHGGQALPMRHFGPPGVVAAPPHDQVGTGYSPDRARLEMDGSSFGDCRLLPTITYLVSASDIALQQAELLREMWVEELGCREDQIVIEQVQFGTLLANTRPDAGGQRPDMWDLGWASYYPDENNWLNDVLHCRNSENRQLRPCSEADQLIEQAGHSLDPAERLDLYRRAESLFFSEGGIEPISPLFVRANYLLRQPWISHTPAHFGGERYDTAIVDAAVKALERTR